jgi:hypothetical protein
MPGNEETRPNPVFCAMSTHPDHALAAAGAATASNTRDRTVRSGRASTGDCFPVVGAGTGPRRPGVSCGGRVGGEDSHPGHHPSAVASGWGSPVSAARAAATSARLART